MSEFTQLLTGVLSIFGVSYIVALTHGPFGLFEMAREKIRSTTDTEWIRSGIQCPICISFWAGIPISVWFEGGVGLWASGVGFTCMIMALSPVSEDESDTDPPGTLAAESSPVTPGTHDPGGSFFFYGL